jgi:hypothetical protein
LRGSLIDQILYEASGENRKFIPVITTAKDTDHVPQFLREYTRFAIDPDYDDLYRLLTNQPKVAKPEIGKLRPLPKRERRLDYKRILWNIPGRNHYFTGRDQFLEEIHNALTATPAATLPQAIKGLGGIGKTQIAIEYANRHRGEYEAGFWVTADSPGAIANGFAALANILQLREEDEADLAKVALSTKVWLESNAGWLLILDNIESMGDIKEWIPAGHGGHVLITTQLQATGTIAKGIDLPKMASPEGAEFLLRRGKFDNAIDDERAAAQNLSNRVDGLPLALDQAGAYIEETQLTVREYLTLYQLEGKSLREKSTDSADHASVTATFSLSFSKLSERAKDVIRMSAFLAPHSKTPFAVTTSQISARRKPQTPWNAHELSLTCRRLSSMTVNGDWPTLRGEGDKDRCDNLPHLKLR